MNSRNATHGTVMGDGIETMGAPLSHLAGSPDHRFGGAQLPPPADDLPNHRMINQEYHHLHQQQHGISTNMLPDQLPFSKISEYGRDLPPYGQDNMEANMATGDHTTSMLLGRGPLVLGGGPGSASGNNKFKEIELDVDDDDDLEFEIEDKPGGLGQDQLQHSNNAFGEQGGLHLVNQPLIDINVQDPIEQAELSQYNYHMKDLRTRLRKGEAIRNDIQHNTLVPQHKLQKQIELLVNFSQKLGSIIKENIQHLYQKQFEEVFNILLQAFNNGECNSLLLLSRSKQTLHAFLNAIESEVKQMNQSYKESQEKKQQQIEHQQHQQSNRYKKQQVIAQEEDQMKELRVVRVNSILNNTEQKMLTKFFESLNFKSGQKSYHIEMINEVQEYFKEQKNLCIVFVLEDIDFYIEWSKQHMLYKILDMLGYAQIPFVFIATSQKVDIIDSFEKRIKSRFSQRQIYFYDDDFKAFQDIIKRHFEQHFRPPEYTYLNGNFEEGGSNDEKVDEVEVYKNLLYTLQSDQANEFLQTLFESGKSFEFMIQQLKLSICMIEQQIIQVLRSMKQEKSDKLEDKEIKMEELPNLIPILYTEFTYFYQSKSNEAFQTLQIQLYEQGDPGIIIKQLPRSNVEVLIFAYLVSKKASIFNFEAVYQKNKQWQSQEKQAKGAKIAEMSRQTFLKIFLDLVNQGFLKSESSTDVLSVNNKVALGFRKNDFEKIIWRYRKMLELTDQLIMAVNKE